MAMLNNQRVADLYQSDKTPMNHGEFDQPVPLGQVLRRWMIH